MTRTVHDGNFSQQDLEKITELVRNNNIEVAAKYFGFSFATLHKFRKLNPKLQAAINKGQEERVKTKGGYETALARFQSFNKEEMQQLSDLACKGGLELVTKKYNISIFILNKCRKACAELDFAMRIGLTKKGKKPHKKRYISGSDHDGKAKKPPKELIDSTMKGIACEGEVALANFRELQKQRKLREDVRRVRDGEYDDML